MYEIIQCTSTAAAGETLTCDVAMLDSLIIHCFVAFCFYKIVSVRFEVCQLKPQTWIIFAKSAVQKSSLNEHVYFTFVLL